MSGGVVSYFVTMDTDGEQQIIWRQDINDSCGPACIYMMENLKNRGCTVGGEERVRQISGLLPNGYHDGHGTFASSIQVVMNFVGIRSKYSTQFSGASFGVFVSEDHFPFIAHIRWGGGGGHFIVCAKLAKNGTVVCLDPWSGLTQVPSSALPSYNAPSGSGIFSGIVIYPSATSSSLASF